MAYNLIFNFKGEDKNNDVNRSVPQNISRKNNVPKEKIIK